MGNVYTRPETDLMVYVQTADRHNAGTDATVHMIMYDIDGNKSRPIVLDNYFSNDLERGKLDIFRIPPKKVRKLMKRSEIARIELWKDERWLKGDWYLDTIVVKNNTTRVSFVFPIFRWVKSDYHYNIKHFDTSLPQFDDFYEQRQMELLEKRAMYEYDLRFSDGPVKVKDLPKDEHYSFDYKWDFPNLKSRLTHASMLEDVLSTGKWESLSIWKNVFNESTFSKPKSVNVWDDDVHFALQRVNGFNHSVITKVTSLPDKFPVTDAMVGPLLGVLNLQQAMEQNRLFICDYHILEGCPVKEDFVLCHPIGLFFEDNKKILRPIAIQLFQTPADDNPIFTPLDAPMLWTVVKMWYNNSDSAHHHAVTKFALTQCLMEAFAISTHRNLSQSHPIFRLLVPHFLYLIATNEKTLPYIAAENAWLDRNLNIGCHGFKALLSKGYNAWRLDINGILPQDLKQRGLYDPGVLTCYHFRDDAMLLYDVIRNYVTAYLSIYYKNDEQIEEDDEIQGWATELVTEKEDNGAGLKGIPGNGKISACCQLVDIVTCIIYTCSVSHAATNYPQYEGYGFPPNYPSHLAGHPPTSKTETVTEKDLLNSLADKPNTLETMVFSKLFSSKGTNRLGSYRDDVIFDPDAQKIVKEFQNKLKEVSVEIQSRNKIRSHPYPYLDPEIIPNNISI